MILSLAHIQTKLSNYQYTPIRWQAPLPPQRAAVAIILRFHRSAPDVLLMKRVAHIHDRWSGQISFPGGKASDPEEPALAIAVRETQEELGLDLTQNAQCIGSIDEIQAISRGKFLPMIIQPFVFVQTTEAVLTLSSEAEATIWLPLEQVVAGTLDATYSYESPDTAPLRFPCWNYQGYSIWGLTYKMLARFLAIIA